MTTFVTIIYVIVALVMVLSILLQSGKGGGLGSALGGGASQSVFGGGGGADFMSKLTQGFAFTFMISAMYLAYASAHAGSEFLEEEDQGSVGMFEDDEEIDPERLGYRPQRLPTAEEGAAMQAEATTLVPAQSEVSATELLEGTAPAAEPPATAEDPADQPAPEPGENDDPAEDPAVDGAPPAEEPSAAEPDAADGVDPEPAAEPSKPDGGDSPQGGE